MHSFRLIAIFALAHAAACSHSGERRTQTRAPQTPREPIVRSLKGTGAPMTPAEMTAVREAAEEKARLTDVEGGTEGFEPAFGEEVRSLELLRSTVVKRDPLREADNIGTVVRGTRVAFRGHVEGADCKYRWIELEPRGWICARVRASDGPPTDDVLPRLGDRRVPGVYGKVIKSGLLYEDRDAIERGEGYRPEGGVVVSRTGGLRLDERTFWRTQRGEYVDTAHIRRFWASDWQGVRLGEEEEVSLPIGFALSHRDRGRARVAVREAPRRRARVVRRLARREVVSVLERSPDRAWVRIGEDAWIARPDVRIAREAAPPSEQVAREPWLDVDLDEQVVVAYEGTRPVYATLVSTGRWKHRTPTGVFRITRKKSRTTMNSAPDEAEQYSVANVPWTLYFHEGYALHGTYWHNGFGRPRSHGCVNLAPADAQFIYEWLGPEMPPGWQMQTADEETPGAAVQVRSGDDPEPAFRGYAATLHERAAGQEERERLARAE